MVKAGLAKIYPKPARTVYQVRKDGELINWSYVKILHIYELGELFTSIFLFSKNVAPMGQGQGMSGLD